MTEENGVTFAWRKARRSGHNGCIEVAPAGEMVALRDSKDPHGPIHFYTQHEWYSFLHGAKNGEFDDLLATPPPS
jgi:hypothetical protein